MTSLRLWTQVGAFLAIAMMSSSITVYSDEATHHLANTEGFAAVSPDVDTADLEVPSGERTTEAYSRYPK